MPLRLTSARYSRPVTAGYPTIFAVIEALRSGDRSIRMPEEHLTAELQRIETEAVPLMEVLGESLGDLEDFLRLTLDLHQALGFNRRSRAFVGRLWIEAMSNWDGDARANFLASLVQDPHDVFEALDIAVELFRQVKFSADEVFPWARKAFALVARDLMQQGFWSVIEALCVENTATAVITCERWLASQPTTEELGVIANMLGWLRNGTRQSSAVKADFDRLEASVRQGGSPAWRALYIQSWCQNGGRASFSEDEAIVIRGQNVLGIEEERAWCFLLNVLVRSDRTSWVWTHRELKKVADVTQYADSKHWIASAALNGVESSTDQDAVSRAIWLALLQLLLPLPKGSSIWRLLDHCLTKLVQENSSFLHDLIENLAMESGRTFRHELDQEGLRGFLGTLGGSPIAQSAASRLALSSHSAHRDVGLFLYDRCGVQTLSADIIKSATSQQLEGLLLTAQQRPIAHKSLASLHASLVDRIDDRDRLAKLYYDELSLQCMNSGEYREALSAACPHHEYVQAIIADTKQRLTAIGRASQSPALQMEVPGFTHSSLLHQRRFAELLEDGKRRYSTFLDLFPTIHILYGGDETRLVSPQGGFSPPMQMHSTTVSAELPRLEIIDPEGRTFARLEAAKRVELLQTPVEEKQP